MAKLQQLRWGLPLKPLPPPVKSRDPSVPHAPPLPLTLTAEQQKLAVRNALRYFPSSLHEELAPEFSLELIQYGHIYMYRFVPTFELRAYPIDSYPTKSRHAAAIILMILNNLDWSVAQFPHELITYGGNGQVFSNWAQFWITMKYLCEMTNDQTLVMYSGHPLGLFPSISSGPRVVITNGMVVPNYSRREDYDRMFALGVSMYGQMTAGSYCYIGPQGIVHGTVLTILNAGRKYLGLEKMNRKVFVSSGLGGMSGAQAKAAVICGCIGVIAEVNITALKRRYDQGWLLEIIDDPDALISRIEEARRNNEVTSIGFWGNIVTLWERLVQKLEETGELLVDLGSDQTSCHNPFNGGYYPFQLSFEESQKVLRDDPGQFRQYVQESLRRQINAINKLSDAGMKFWDYGNAFLLEAERAGADVLVENNASCPKFRYPSYVQDIMGDIFSLGFGPFRWVCTSCDPQDLKVTDDIACGVLQSIHSSIASQKVKKQYEDNIHWIQQAAAQNLVVGSQARILYSDQTGRIQLALAFNDAVKAGKLKSPVVISRDHHDVSGTDSPYRETADINDGSSFTADMAVQNFVGDSFRGATWVALHNGGGVGWGEVINGGFGLLLDGTQDAALKARQMLSWDVSNGVARRCWSGNGNAQEAITDAMKKEPRLQVTLPNHVIDEGIIESALKELCGVNNRM